MYSYLRIFYRYAHRNVIPEERGVPTFITSEVVMAFSYIYFLYMYKHISYAKKVKKKVLHSLDHKNQIVHLKQGVIIFMYCGDIFYFYKY